MFLFGRSNSLMIAQSDDMCNQILSSFWVMNRKSTPSWRKTRNHPVSEQTDRIQSLHVEQEEAKVLEDHGKNIRKPNIERAHDSEGLDSIDETSQKRREHNRVPNSRYLWLRAEVVEASNDAG